MAHMRNSDRSAGESQPEGVRVAKKIFQFGSSWENRVLLVVLVVLLAASIITSVFNVNARWQTPLIFLALIAIINLLTPVGEIHSDVRYLRQLSSSARISPYSTVDAFYADLRHALTKADYNLDLTHIRDNPPDDFKDHTSGWYDTLLDWLAADGSRSARRIISVRNEQMREWAETLATTAQEQPRLHVAVVDWSVGAPAINMAIIDGNVVFLAVTGQLLERTCGVAIEDKAVAQYFVDYYNNLWGHAMPLGDYLRGHPRSLTKQGELTP
jgi:hypothetical protein